MAKKEPRVADFGTPARMEDLIAFVVAVSTGSLTATSRRLGLPKSTVSRRLSRLEEHLGVQLLVRGPGGLEASEAGQVAYEPARALLDDLKGLEELVQGIQATPRGRLRVSAPADLAGMPWWMEFADRFREVRLEIEFTNRYVDLVREGFDVALRGGLGDDQNLMARRLGAYRLRAVASPDWVRRHGIRGAGQDLFAEEAIALSRPKAPGRGSQRSGRILVANDNRTALDGALRGLGVAVLPDHLCDRHLANGSLQIAHREYDPLEVPLYAVYPERRRSTAALGAFLDAAGGVFGKP